jgi:two-component system nitrogen regulation sensor histidine kinase NtrY
MSSECQKRHIRWANELAPRSLLVEIDVHQMGQAIMNIVKNAVEAIDHDGCITVQTTFDSRTLCIIDDGEGLRSEDLPNLFTQFFSTKRNGQGVGLTLVREVLTNHGFGFNLERNADPFTVFRIELDQSKREA